jgi:hypothetical protein
VPQRTASAALVEGDPLAVDGERVARSLAQPEPGAVVVEADVGFPCQAALDRHTKRLSKLVDPAVIAQLAARNPAELPRPLDEVLEPEALRERNALLRPLEAALGIPSDGATAGAERVRVRELRAGLVLLEQVHGLVERRARGRSVSS